MATAVADTHMADSAPIKVEEQTKHTMTPPASDEGNKIGDDSSELSEPIAEEEDDIGEIEPDHYWDGGRVPVFKPVCRPLSRSSVSVVNAERAT
jgi:hypothetical protein